MTFFSTSDKLEIGGIPFVSNNIKPTRPEALEYYRRVATSNKLTIHLQEEVKDITASNGKYQVVTTKQTYTTTFVVIATGFYDIPVTMNIPGEDLPKVLHYYREPHPYYNQDVAVIGAKNSAAIAALELYWTGARVTLIHRGAQISEKVKYWIRPNIENRIKSGEIKAYFHSKVVEIRPDSIVLNTPQGEILLKNDFVFALIGYSPDLEFLNSIGVTLDPATQKPRTDPATLESERSGVYLAGVIVAGMHTNEIFIENGRFHGKLVADAIASNLGKLKR
jgi:thioredoxin reductase (NADPH)